MLRVRRRVLARQCERPRVRCRSRVRREPGYGWPVLRSVWPNTSRNSSAESTGASSVCTLTFQKRSHSLWNSVANPVSAPVDVVLAELDAGDGILLLDEFDETAERLDEGVVPDAEIADRPAAAPLDLRRFHHDEAGAAGGSRANSTVTTFAGSKRLPCLMALTIACPSKTDPPGELMR